MTSSLITKTQKPPVAPSIDKMASKESVKPARASSILVRGIDTLTHRRRSLMSRRDSNNSSFTEESLGDKKMVRFNTKKNKEHAVASRKHLESSRSEIWYSKQELGLMNQAASAAVYYSDSIQKYADVCASFHQSLTLTAGDNKTTTPARPVLEAPRVIQEGLNCGYRGLELHCKAGSQRYGLVTDTVKKVVRKHRVKLANVDDEQAAATALAKYCMKLTRPNKDWAMVLAQLDLAAIHDDFEIHENMDLPESLAEESSSNDEATLLYL